MNRIDPEYYFKKMLKRRKRQAFEAFMFISSVIMFILAILIYIRYGR